MGEMMEGVAARSILSMLRHAPPPVSRPERNRPHRLEAQDRGFSRR
jgi:hypothetical protein